MLDLYQSYIAKSRYARFLDDKGRRENWDETVDRYVSFMQKHMQDNYKFDEPELFTEIRNAILNLEVMPSMRALMAAGKPLDRDNTCGYNCAYLPVDDLKAFDETMAILMAGTGVGFSVERQYVNKMPEIPDKLFNCDITIVVKDSREGWAKGFRMLISLLYAGEIPKWDLSKLRGPGARLHTMGGRSSGPEPLNQLFKFTVNLFKNAAGRKLTSIECHDLMCKIADVVVVGGVRRSAMISLSNLSDDRMRSAKSGSWWLTDPQRSLSNNSAVYNEKPELALFIKEWLSLYESKSGERGIINREAMKLQVEKNQRRESDFEFGVNPCSEIILRPYQFCNLTEIVVRENDTEESVTKKAITATVLGTFQATLTHFPYLRKIWQKNTEEERLLGVSITGIYDNKLFNNYKDKKLPERLQAIRDIVIGTNKQLAEKLGINQSVAVTCVKPSGTVSQLADVSSGIHPGYTEYYLRRVRNDNKDPLTQFMINAGVPAEPDYMKPDSTTVFSFAKKSPKSSILREEISAIEHLELWLIYQRNWCEHKPSVTISIKEDEWLEVGSWVWMHWDEMTGVSFLPWDGGTYQQAPFEAITAEQYQQHQAKMPKDIDWNLLKENDDNVEGIQNLACSAGGCMV